MKKYIRFLIGFLGVGMLIGCTYAVDLVLDPIFKTGVGFNSQIVHVARQTGSKIVVGGTFTSYSGVTANRIVRLNGNGTFDTGFTMGVGFDNAINSMTMQSDGKIIVGGTFISYNLISANRIVRLNVDGTIDAGFNVGGSGFNNIVRALVEQPDGKILAAGLFSNYNGTTVNGLIRLNSNGSIDNSFVVNTGAGSSIARMAIQTDGKIVLGGQFTNYSGVTLNGLMRMNSDGTIDNTFTKGTSMNAGMIWRIGVQPDGKIVLGGAFTGYNATPSNRIIRLNTDGTIDGSFSIGSAFNNTVSMVMPQSDGKIYVGGQFTGYNGAPASGLVRLNNDGTLDTSFTLPGTGFTANSFVWDMFTQTDGSLVVGGDFTHYNGTLVNRLVRLLIPDAIPDAYDLGGPLMWFSSWVNINTDYYSSGVVVKGINVATPITVTGAEYSINSGAYVTTTGSVMSGDLVVLRLHSAGGYNQTTTGVLTIGGIADSFIITTIPGGGSGPIVIPADECPNGDYSPTQYDKECGTKPGSMTGDSQGTGDAVQGSGTIITTGSIDTGSVVDTGVIIPTPMVGACIDPETQRAYEFAYDKEITTMPTCEKANMDEPLLRRDAAKMISNFAIYVMGKLPNIKRACLFDDMKYADPDSKKYAIIACNLGLMGVNNTTNRSNENFQPNEYVDKAQWATIISRLLYDDTYNGDGDLWYKRHVEKLMKDGVIMNASNLFRPIHRGEAMIMLMRLYK